MIRYYKLFDLLNRRGMKKSDLREIISPKTVAKLSKGEYVSGEVIDKICLYLHCQPSDIMEVIEWESEENDFTAYETSHIRETAWMDNDELVDITDTVINFKDKDE